MIVEQLWNSLLFGEEKLAKTLQNIIILLSAIQIISLHLATAGSFTQDEHIIVKAAKFFLGIKVIRAPNLASESIFVLFLLFGNLLFLLFGIFMLVRSLKQKISTKILKAGFLIYGRCLWHIFLIPLYSLFLRTVIAFNSDENIEFRVVLIVLGITTIISGFLLTIPQIILCPSIKTTDLLARNHYYYFGVEIAQKFIISTLLVFNEKKAETSQGLEWMTVILNVVFPLLALYGLMDRSPFFHSSTQKFYKCVHSVNLSAGLANMFSRMWIFTSKTSLVQTVFLTILILPIIAKLIFSFYHVLKNVKVESYLRGGSNFQDHYLAKFIVNLGEKISKTLMFNPDSEKYSRNKMRLIFYREVLSNFAKKQNISSNNLKNFLDDILTNSRIESEEKLAVAHTYYVALKDVYNSYSIAQGVFYNSKSSINSKLGALWITQQLKSGQNLEFDNQSELIYILKGMEKYESLLRVLSDHLQMHKSFYTLLTKNDPCLHKVYSYSKKSQVSLEKIEHIFNHIPSEVIEKCPKLLKFYGLFLIALRFDIEKGANLLKQQNLITINRKNTQITDESLNKFIMNSKSVFVQLSLKKSNFSEILKISPTFYSMLSVHNQEIMKKSIDIIFPGSQGAHYKTLIQNKIFSENSLFKPTGTNTFLSHKYGHLVPVRSYFMLYPIINDNLTLLSIFTPVELQKSFILYNERGKLEAATDDIRFTLLKFNKMDHISRLYPNYDNHRSSSNTSFSSIAYFSFNSGHNSPPITYKCHLERPSSYDVSGYVISLKRSNNEKAKSFNNLDSKYNFESKEKIESKDKVDSKQTVSSKNLSKTNIDSKVNLESRQYLDSRLELDIKNNNETKMNQDSNHSVIVLETENFGNVDERPEIHRILMKDSEKNGKNYLYPPNSPKNRIVDLLFPTDQLISVDDNNPKDKYLDTDLLEQELDKKENDDLHSLISIPNEPTYEKLHTHFKHMTNRLDFYKFKGRHFLFLSIFTFLLVLGIALIVSYENSTLSVVEIVKYIDLINTLYGRTISLGNIMRTMYVDYLFKTFYDSNDPIRAIRLASNNAAAKPRIQTTLEYHTRVKDLTNRIQDSELKGIFYEKNIRVFYDNFAQIPNASSFEMENSFKAFDILISSSDYFAQHAQSNMSLRYYQDFIATLAMNDLLVQSEAYPNIVLESMQKILDSINSETRNLYYICISTLALYLFASAYIILDYFRQSLSFTQALINNHHGEVHNMIRAIDIFSRRINEEITEEKISRHDVKYKKELKKSWKDGRKKKFFIQFFLTKILFLIVFIIPSSIILSTLYSYPSETYRKASLGSKEISNINEINLAAVKLISVSSLYDFMSHIKFENRLPGDVQLDLLDKIDLYVSTTLEFSAQTTQMLNENICTYFITSISRPKCETLSNGQGLRGTKSSIYYLKDFFLANRKWEDSVPDSSDKVKQINNEARVDVVFLITNGIYPAVENFSGKITDELIEELYERVDMILMAITFGFVNILIILILAVYFIYYRIGQERLWLVKTLNFLPLEIIGGSHHIQNYLIKQSNDFYKFCKELEFSTSNVRAKSLNRLDSKFYLNHIQNV